MPNGRCGVYSGAVSFDHSPSNASRLSQPLYPRPGPIGLYPRTVQCRRRLQNFRLVSRHRMLESIFGSWTKPSDNRDSISTSRKTNVDYFLSVLEANLGQESWEQIVNQDNVFVCCPPALTLNSKTLSRRRLQSHVLKSTNEACTEFRTLLNQHVDLIGSCLFLGDGFSNTGKKVKLLQVEKISTGSNQFVNVFFVSQSLSKGIYVPEDLDDIGVQMAAMFVAALRWYPSLEPIFLEMDDFIRDIKLLGKLTNDEGFIRLRPSCLSVLHKHWAMSCAALICATFTLGIRFQDETDRFSIDQFSDDHLKHIMEAYMYRRCGKRLYHFIALSNRRDNEHFQEQIDFLSLQSFDYFKIAPAFEVGQDAAILTLRGIRDVFSPADKLIVMRRTVQSIHDTLNKELLVQQRQSTEADESVNEGGETADSEKQALKDAEFSTDDLISVLVYVMVQACDIYRHSDQRPVTLFTDLIFARDWHFCSNENSDMAFILCHFEVAINWILSRDLVAHVMA